MTSCNATQQTFVVSLGCLRVAAEILTCRIDSRGELMIFFKCKF